MDFKPMDDDLVTSEAELRALYGAPDDLPILKVQTRLDAHCRAFIAASPFFILATHDGAGNCTASPRGDQPGFVQVLGDKHLFLADKRGNDRIDSLMNVLRAPGVGMLFLIPGLRETLRIDGRARITRNRALLDPHGEGDKIALTGLIIEVEQAYLHCARSILKAKIWSPETWPDKKVIAPAGRIWADHIANTRAQQDAGE